jgi:hypothetical protein
LLGYPSPLRLPLVQLRPDLRHEVVRGEQKPLGTDRDLAIQIFKFLLKLCGRVAGQLAFRRRPPDAVGCQHPLVDLLGQTVDDEFEHVRFSNHPLAAPDLAAIVQGVLTGVGDEVTALRPDVRTPVEGLAAVATE